MRKAVYAGSFDMPTKGHESTIEYAFGLVDELVVAIGVNPAKKTMFTLEERLLMLEDVKFGLTRYGHGNNITITHFTVDEYQVDFAESIGAQYIIRGLRSAADYEVEQVMCEKNHVINPRIKSIFVMSDPKYRNVASSTVKMMMGPEGWSRAVKNDLPESMIQTFFFYVAKHEIPIR